MKHPRLYPLTLAIAMALTTSTAATANLANSMDMMYNTTAPGMMSSGRQIGGYLGGAQIRMPVQSFNLVSFDAPRFSAGCAGIDAYFGSFSMISSANYGNLVRGIIASGAGYTLELALSSLCPPCATIMSKLQGLMSDINSKAKNTCELAKTVVEGGRAIYNGDTNVSQSAERLVAVVEGAVNDAAKAWESLTADPKALRPGAADKSTSYGNTLVNTMYSSDVLQSGSANTAVFGGDQETAQLAMSLFGFSIRPVTGNNPDKSLESIITFRDLRDGSVSPDEIAMYRCRDWGGPYGCQTVNTGPMQFRGAVRYVAKMLGGDQATGSGAAIYEATDGSILAALADGANFQMTDQQRAFWATVPLPVQSGLIEAARMGRNSATYLMVANDATQILGNVFAVEQLRELERMVRIAHKPGSAGGKDVVELTAAQTAAMARRNEEAQAAGATGNALAQRMEGFQRSVKLSLAAVNRSSTGI